jgi:non-specific serine/threonine protein kinase
MDAKSASRPGVDNLNPLPVGTRLQEFVIERLIGIGGFGIVYQANDTLLHRTVAIKEYMPTSMASRSDGATVSLRSESYIQDFETGKTSFINEARMLARFKHSALIEVFRFWEQNSTAYMATPFYEGRTLKDYLRDMPGIPKEAELRDMLMPVLDAIEHMHKEQIFHRDISPDNIMILSDGRPILLDLGAARRVEAENAQALTVLVKPGYAPIEQYAGDASVQQGPWTDLYGFGASAYFALIGKPPPPSASRIMSDSIVKLAQVKPPGYSHAFLAAIDAALAVRPDDRPQSVAAFRALLTLELPPEVRETENSDKKDSEIELAADFDPDATIILPKTSLKSAAATSSNIEPSPNAAEIDSSENKLIATSVQPPRQVVKAVPTPSVTSKPGKPKGVVIGGLVGLAGLIAAFWWFAKSDSKPEAQPAAMSKDMQNTPPVQAASTPATPEPIKTEAAAPSTSKNPEPKIDTSKVDELKATSEQKPAVISDPVISGPVISGAVASSSVASAPALSPPQATTTAAPTETPPKPEATENASPAIDKPGLVRLAIKPWGQVFLNGESKGVSPPLKSLSLPAGDHTIEIRNGDYPSRKMRVKIKAGETFKINHAFADAAPKN